ncbi:MAG: leucine--tRNA ligase [Candidatus Cloacimonetes bacterium]|nr:leucine--tRNA ligase [Candidatus Cloacimonadota bacterium]
MAGYEHQRIEKKWQDAWAGQRTFRTELDPSKPKYYILDMFPYPSGAGLHMGHPEGYTATDILARWKRMNGFNVLHPMGWDAFGLPTERFAERTGQHPADVTRDNCNTFRRQIQALGLSYDWEREISTSDPEYYRWTQWIFLQLYHKGLAYPAEVAVNWCPALGTVLANEEVKDGRYVETGDPVEKRKMRQWMLRITEYAQRLLDDLDGLDWPEGVLTMQREWIGRSEGADVRFAVDGHDADFTVFTTRPDTLFGATYCVLAPEHPLVSRIVSDECRTTVQAYLDDAARKSDVDRQDENREKTGVFTGAYALNPVNGARVPIWVADYVLGGYGTGAIMAVPGHDARDWEFARTFDLPILEVVAGGDVSLAAHTDNSEGVLVNSGLLDGLKVPAAKARIINWLEEHGLGEGRVNYKLRDWLFSRQRYWGEPFPLLLDDKGTVHAVAEQDLPVSLPVLDNFKPTEDGRPPLARAGDWLEVRDTETGELLIRETNTMPQWAGSCWYYLRFIDPHNSEQAWSPEAENYWMPVDLYVGGAEHAVLHLLYARFWHKVLYDLGLVHTKEPFQKLYNQGMILGASFRDAKGKYHPAEDVEQGPEGWRVIATGEAVVTQIEKMSKSRLNVVNPDDMVREFGADAVRLYEMFMGPLDRDKPWSDEGIRGCHHFLKRIWNLCVDRDGGLSPRLVADAADEDTLRLLHRTIRAVTRDLEDLKFNTAIARLMELVNGCYRLDTVPRSLTEVLVLLLAPFAPHLAEELWSMLGHPASLAYETWPTWDEALCREDSLEVAIQVNGKVRATLNVALETSDADVLELALSHEKIAPLLDGKKLKFSRRVSPQVVALAIA